MSVFKNVYQEQYEKINAESFCNSMQNKFIQFQSYETALISSFVWDNLPEHIRYFKPEQHMFYRGLAAGFYDDDNLFQIYPAFPNGKLRKDGYYSDYTMYAADGTVYYRKFEDIELLENMPSQIPTIAFVLYYCEKMERVLNVIDVQLIKSQGGDIFEVEDEAQKAQVAEIWNNMVKNIPIQSIITDKFSNHEINHMTLYDSRESQILDMWGIYDKFKHEFYTLMGINNVEHEKKERLISDEANSNNDAVRHSFYENQYLSRLDFCKRCKEHFGLDIIVYKNRITESDTMSEIIEEEVSQSEIIEEVNDRIEETTEDEEQSESTKNEDTTTEQEDTENEKDE